MSLPESAASPSPARPPSLRYHSLDFWRGVACLAVIVFHSTFYLTENPAIPPQTSIVGRVITAVCHSGFLGVPLFFVISGYCITAACMRNSGGVRRYFYRRFRRIYPPAWIWLAISLLIVGVVWMLNGTHLLFDSIHPVHDPTEITPWGWVGNLTLTETWLANLGNRDESLFNGHYWSLCYEEQFYAVCGLTLFFFGASRRFFAVMLAITVLALVGLTAGGQDYADFSQGFFFDGKWLMFAAGIAVFYRVHMARKPWAYLIDASLLGVIALYAVLKGAVPTLNLTTTSAALFFAFGLVWLWRIDKPFAESRVTRPVSWCGEMCYSLYLTNWPVAKVVSRLLYDAGVQGLWPTILICLPICAAVSILVGRVFFLLVERRFLNTKPVSSGFVSPHAQASPPVVAGSAG